MIVTRAKKVSTPAEAPYLAKMLGKPYNTVYVAQKRGQPQFDIAFTKEKLCQWVEAGQQIKGDKQSIIDQLGELLSDGVKYELVVGEKFSSFTPKLFKDNIKLQKELSL